MLHYQKNKLKKNIEGDDYLEVGSAASGCINLATFASPKTNQHSPRGNHCFPEPEDQGC